jgi:hypothetical protein
MKKLFILACTLALGSALSFAQAAGGGKPENQTPSASSQAPASSASTTTKKTSKSHKTKKAKKSSTDTTAPASTATPK